MIPITLRQLEILVQIVEAGNFRRCAERIGVSQVAISEHVRALEGAVGGKLFMREPGLPATLTPLGARVCERAREILDSISMILTENFEHHGSGERSILKVNAPSYIIGRIHPLIAELQCDFPDFQIDFVPKRFPIADTDHNLATGIADVHYGFRAADMRVEGGHRVFEEKLAFFVRVGHPLLDVPDVSLSMLGQYDTFHLAPDNPLRDLVDRTWAHAGLQPKSILLESDDWSLLMASAAQCNAFVCMFGSAGETVPGSFGLRKLNVKTDLLKPIAIYRFLSQRAAGNASVRRIVSRLDERLREMRPAFER